MMFQTLLQLWCVFTLVNCGHQKSRSLTAARQCIDLNSAKSTGRNIENCEKDGKYCGDWVGRVWKPLGCEYRDVTAENARKCMSGRTVACIGDSQIRDFCFGLGHLLDGVTVESADAEHMIRPEHESIWQLVETIPPLDFEKEDKSRFNRIVMPKKSLQLAKNYTWQVQIWNQAMIQENKKHLSDVLTSKYLSTNSANSSTATLKKIDFALYNIGLHHHALFTEPPFGPNYYNHLVMPWIGFHNNFSMPLVWFFMNNQCEEKKDPKLRYQLAMVDQANNYTLTKLREAKLPYFDSATVFRSPQRCEISGDGVHVFQWVDIVRAKIFLNRMCDEDWNWIGKVENYM